MQTPGVELGVPKLISGRDLGEARYLSKPTRSPQNASIVSMSAWQALHFTGSLSVTA
jgi:hypothetical protein